MSLTDQKQTLPRKTLFVTLACCTASLFVSFFDQTAVTTSIPSIAASLDNADIINSWVGSSYLVANTTFQLLYGRFSDIFGRKSIFLFSLGCLILGNLVSGFAVSPTMLFLFRAISGIGGGGINCLVMITFSDLLTTRQRGKYFGFVAVSTSLGNGLGPLIGGILSEKVTWKWAFWITCPVAVLCSLLVIFFVPLKQVEGDFKQKLKKVDWLGSLTSTIAFVFILVAVSGGGDSWPWKSATFIVLVVLGAIAVGLFFFVESRIASIPMIPLHLFSNFQRLVLFLMCFMMGWAYFVDIYYYPLYLQNVRGMTPIMSGVLQLPATCSSSVFGVVAGFVNSHTGKYVQCLYFGGAMWVLGTGLKISYGLESNYGLLIGANLVQGLGIGFTFQPTLLALLANSDSQDRAVVTGIRNFFRCFGGAVGLIISGIIFNTCLKRKLELNGLTQAAIAHILADPSTIRDLSDKDVVIKCYLESFIVIMEVLTALSGAMFVFSLMARDQKEEPEVAKKDLEMGAKSEKNETHIVKEQNVIELTDSVSSK